MMAANVAIACPVCREVFSLPAELVDVEASTDQVTLSVDRSAVYGHLTACAAKAAAKATEAPGKAVAKVVTTVPAGELAGRIGNMLAIRAYVATGGSRACTMCGATGEVCIDQLAEAGPRVPCCPSCGEGNTHPAPREDASCAEWAVEYGAKD